MKTSPLQKEIRQRQPFRSRRQEATLAILRTADTVRRLLTGVLEPHGITLQQYNVLRILRGAHPEPMPTLEIGERLVERVPGVTRLLDRLEAKRLIRRERAADDRRMVLCAIAPQGLELLARTDAAVNEADEAPISALSDAEVERLLRMLERVRVRSDY